jgi:hypothetical protein
MGVKGKLWFYCSSRPIGPPPQVFVFCSFRRRVGKAVDNTVNERKTLIPGTHAPGLGKKLPDGL